MRKHLYGIGVSALIAAAVLPASAAAARVRLLDMSTSTRAEFRAEARAGATTGSEGGLGSTSPVRDTEQLRQMLEERRREIAAAIASSSPSDKAMFEHASAVSIAAHALVAARDMLGGNVGQQISQIAQSVNDSLATTTVAEAKIDSRGFFTKLFFGGDRDSAAIIAQQAAENQARIQQIESLLSSASTTADVKSALTDQVQAMKAEESRLQALAQGQSKMWGIFSWRF